MHWLFLGLAIVAEVVATTALKSTHGFTRLGPSLLVVAGYGVAFYCLTLTLRVIPIGVTYAIWSGVGIALVSLLGWLIYDQKLSGLALFGMALIAVGVAVVQYAGVPRTGP